MKQTLLDIGFEVRPSFANFVTPTESLSQATQHLQLWVSSVHRSPLPTYLWGESGSGKTHLLRACQAAIEAQGAACAWLDASILEPQAYRSEWTVLILDDVHLYTAVQQQAAFNWFVNAQAEQAWILASGLVAPAQLKLREDLRTRLGWGHSFELPVLDESERRAVLQKAANERGIVLRDDVVDFILTRFSRDLSHLMQLLDHLDQYAMQNQRPITIPLVKKMMDDLDA